LPTIKKMLNDMQINAEIMIGIADFEGFSKECLERFSMTEDEFMFQVESSRSLLEELTKTKVHFISQLAGGKEYWVNGLSDIKQFFSEGAYGLCNITYDGLLDIARKRRDLYSRWYGPKESLDEFVPVVLSQGAEYALMGQAVLSKFKNCLVMGAETCVFSCFYDYVKFLPKLYMKKSYC